MSIGQPVPRLEDLRLTTGNGRYTSDFWFAHTCYAFFVRSEYAHALIKSIDVSAAAEADGVLAVFLANDYAEDGRKPIPHNAVPPDAVDASKLAFADDLADGHLFETDQPPLAVDRVRYIGEAVAMVVAETLAQARDAAELVEVRYESLPALAKAEDAMQPGAPELWEGAPGNLGLRVDMGDPEGVDAAFAKSHLVIERVFPNQRIVACQMEPRSAIGLYDAAEDFYTVYAGNQGVMRWKMALARALGRDPAKVRVVCPDVGGGFGPRTSIAPEPVLVTWAASKLGRPVRWVSDRTESFLTDYQGRDITVHMATAFDAEGKILGLRQTHVCNIGAYPVSYAPLANSHRIVSTVYHVPIGVVGVRGVFTNTVSTVPYRGAGRPEVTFAMERTLDIAAARLGLDRVEIRRRNLVAKSALPYRTFMGLTLDSGDFLGNMERVLALADWSGFDGRREESRARGKLRGVGVANYVESPVGAPRERLELKVGGFGAEILTGTQSTGQGHETTYAQVVMSLLGIAHHQVRLVTGDTNLVHLGGGTHSDRSMRLVGTLLADACAQVIEKGKVRAAQFLECTPEDIRFNAGIFASSTSNKTVDLRALAADSPFEAAAEVGKRLPAFPTGCAVCELEIDPETGETTITRYSSVDDVGQPINPLIVDGQVHGGIAQGIGQALQEEFSVDPNTAQVLSASFMDYCVPHADSLPSFDVELAEDPTELNPLRIKGGGEGGITPATAAVIGAVAHALAGRGIEHIDMPATAFKIWTALHEGPAVGEADAA